MLIYLLTGCYLHVTSLCMVKSLAYASQLAGMRKVLKHCLHVFVALELIIAALCTVHIRLNTSPKKISC